MVEEIMTSLYLELRKSRFPFLRKSSTSSRGMAGSPSFPERLCKAQHTYYQDDHSIHPCPVFYHREYFQETDKVKRQHSSLKTTEKEDYQDKATGERKTRLQMIQPKKLKLQGQQEYRTQSRQRFVHQES